MALMRGRLFAGALFAGALFGSIGSPVLPIPRQNIQSLPSMTGGKRRPIPGIEQARRRTLRAQEEDIFLTLH